LEDGTVAEMRQDTEDIDIVEKDGENLPDLDSMINQMVSDNEK